MRAVDGNRKGNLSHGRPPWLSIRLILSSLLALAFLAPAQIARAADATPVTPGTPFSVDLPNYDDEAAYSFSGSAGQRVTLRTGLGDCCISLNAHLRSPDGGEPGGANQINAYGELDTLLPSTGTWILVLHNDFFAHITTTATLGLVTDQAGTLALGQQTISTFATSGVNANLSFAGTAGDKVALSIESLDLSSNPSNDGAFFRFLRPDGSELFALDTYSGKRFAKVVLDVSGTWVLRIDPVSDLTGSITFSVSRTVDQIVNAQFGTPLTVTLTGGGQDVQVRLPATSAQRLVVQRITSDLRAEHGRADPPYVDATIVRPDDPAFRNYLGSGNYAESQDLTGTGTYAVLLEPYDDTAGTLKLKITAVSDRTLTTSIGKSVQVKASQPGQNLGYSFYASAGKTLVAALDDVSLTAGSAGADPADAGLTATLIAPNGDRLEQLFYGQVTYAERPDLPFTGTYKLEINPTADTLGTVTLSLSYPKVTTARLALGTSTTATFGRAGSSRYTFSGTAGERLGVQVTAANLTSQTGDSASVDLQLIRPDGGVFYSGNTFGRPGFIEFPALDMPGTWTLVANPSRSTSGSLTFTAREIVDQVLPITLGRQVTAKITVPGQSVLYTFRGTATMRVAVDTLSANWTNISPFPEDNAVNVHLKGPNGEYKDLSQATPYPSETSSTTWAEPFPAQLGATGIWTLVISPLNGTVGSKTFTLRQLDDITGSITYGQTKQVTLPSKGAWATYTFAFNGTGTLTWSTAGSTIPDGRVQLIDPSGSIYRDDHFSSGRGTASNVFQGDPGGKWSIRVLAGIGQTGTTKLTLTRSP